MDIINKIPAGTEKEPAYPVKKPIFPDPNVIVVRMKKGVKKCENYLIFCAQIAILKIRFIVTRHSYHIQHIHTLCFGKDEIDYERI